MSSSSRRTVPPHGTASHRYEGSPSGGNSRPSGQPSSSMAGSGSPARASPSRQPITPVSARAAMRKTAPPRSNAVGQQDDDARAENAQLVDDLKTQLQKAESASEQYLKQLEVLQLRLDEVTKEYITLEEKIHTQDNQILSLQSEAKDNARQLREMELSIESERSQLAKEKEDHVVKEEELQAVIQRLNENLKQRDGPRAISRSSSFRNRSSASPDLDNGQYAPPTGLERSPSRNNSKLLLQKDKMIESLRLELAEAQIKVAELEHMGDGRLQELEKVLLDTRMANARLMEDNESFQLLLSEKTLKGDFMPEPRAATGAPEGAGSLADELESINESTETHQEGEDTKKHEQDMKALRDQNKALTLYIDRIIGRLLQHEGFEHIILDKSDPPGVPPKAAGFQKDLPPPPKEAVQSFLQRAKSVVSGPARVQPKPRPMSYMPPRSDILAPSANENPETAPSIPLGRKQSVRTQHRRSRSEQENIDPSAGAVVGQMVRGNNMRSPSGGPLSPGLNSPRQGVFAPSTGAASSGQRSTSGATTNAAASGAPGGADRGSSSNSVISDHSGDVDSSGMPSPPRSNTGLNNYTGAVMKQNQLRPLRLVKENADDEEALRKKANRGSWIAGWFNQGGQT